MYFGFIAEVYHFLWSTLLFTIFIPIKPYFKHASSKLLTVVLRSLFLSWYSKPFLSWCVLCVCTMIHDRIVRSYLLHYGYQDTLNSFDMASETDPPANHQNGYGEPPEIYGLSHRKLLRQVSWKLTCHWVSLVILILILISRTLVV
jgi:hypothetical protein